jgi:DNA-binding CsgD family transcriptional regulator
VKLIEKMNRTNKNSDDGSEITTAGNTSGGTSRVADPLPQDLKHDRVVLSNRENKVISKTRHKTYAEVAGELGIAESTVGTYYNRATEKLDEQVAVMKTMLDQQRDACRDADIATIARYAVERLHDDGVDAQLTVNDIEKAATDTSTQSTTATQSVESDEATAEEPEGKLGDDHEYTERIREYANEVVHKDEWPLEDVNLSRITFETRTKARRRHGVAQYDGLNRVTIGISEHSIDNAGFETAKQTIRHELVHAWQYQHKGETVELPNGTVIEDIDTGHTGCWYEWENLMDVQRTNKYYERSAEEYKYRIWCGSCHGFVAGRHRMCDTVRCHSESNRIGIGWCSQCDEGETDRSTFVVTDDDDDFYDRKQGHSDW